MLQNIGDALKSQKWLGYLILGALALVFAAWIPSGVVEFSGVNNRYAAQVNGEDIPVEEVNELWQQQQPQLLQAFGGNLTEAQRNEAQQRLLDNQIRRVAAIQQADKLGFRVTDAQLVRAIQEEQAFHVDGKFDAQVYRSRLASAGLTEAAYEADLRKGLLSNQLAAAIAGTDFLTPAEMRRLLALQDEQREVRFLMLLPDKFATGTEVIAEADIESYYKANAAEFTQPEAVKLAYAEISLADVAQTVAVSDEALQQRYERSRDSYVEPERRRARHILISVDGTTPDAKARAEAEALAKRLSAGEDFAALAKQFSKDSASAVEGGDLGWSAREAYVQPFADALFALKEGETTPPVKTQFGYHIIRLEGIRAGAMRSFDDVRPELAAQLRNELAAEAFGNRQEELQTRIERGGVTLAQLAQEFRMRTGEVPRFEKGAGGLPLGSDADLNSEVFMPKIIEQRVVGGPVPLGEERLAIFQVQSHEPPKARPLADVRAGIVATLQRQRGAAAATQAAEAAVARLAAGETFDKMAGGLKLVAEAPKYIGRGSPDLPVELRDAAFDLPRPEAGKPQRRVVTLEGGGAAVLEVTAVRNDAGIDNPQLMALRAQREQQRYSLRDISAYLESLVGTAKITKNSQAFVQ